MWRFYCYFIKKKQPAVPCSQLSYLHPAQAFMCLCVYGFSFLHFLAEILLWENGSASPIPEPHPGHQQRDHVDQWLWGRRAPLWLEWQEHWYCQEAGVLLCKTIQPPHAFHLPSLGIVREEQPLLGETYHRAFLHSFEVPWVFYQQFSIKYYAIMFWVRTGHFLENFAPIQRILIVCLFWPCNVAFLVQSTTDQWSPQLVLTVITLACQTEALESSSFDSPCWHYAGVRGPWLSVTRK